MQFGNVIGATGARHQLESIFFTENSHRYPGEQKQAVLNHEYEILCIRVSPHELGFPMRRPRTFTAGISRAKYVWLGPSDASAIEADYKSWFGKVLQLSGNVYFCASNAQIVAWVRKVLEHKHRALPAGWENAHMDEYLSLLLAPSALGRKHVYDQDRAAKMSAEYICDLDHNLGFGPSPGPVLPCLDSHPSIFSYNHRRLAIPAELLAAQGIDAMPDLSGQRQPSELGLLLQQLGDRDLKALLGNSIHVPSYASWFLYYVLSNCMRRGRVETMSRSHSSECEQAVHARV